MLIPGTIGSCMVLCIVLLAVPLGATFVWFAGGFLLRRLGTSPRLYFAAAFILSLLPGVVLTLLLGALGTLAYNGSCFGLGGNATPCPWSEFAASQFLTAALIGLLLTVLSLPLNLALFYVRWRVMVL